MKTQRTRVVIVGAGFAGLNVAKGLRKAPVDILLVDRNNYHTFTPLLYQVATCGLDPSDIAYPVRGILRSQSNLRFLLGTVSAIDTNAKTVTMTAHDGSVIEPYDHLVLAAGTVTSYFGNAEIGRFSFDIKTLEGSLELRNHVLRQFEAAAWTDDPQARRAMTTMVVVGGGATGIETAGSLFELYNFVFKREYPQIADLEPKVVLIEATDRLLAPYPERLRAAAVRQLESLGVDVRLGVKVMHARPGAVSLSDGTTIETHTLVWAAGIEGSPLARSLGVSLERGGRIPVNGDLTAVGLEGVYVIGDMAYLVDPATGQPHPQVIPVAIQMAKIAAANIVAALEGREAKSFVYFDKGMMATIGRSRAVAWPFNRVQLTGYIAWLTWLMLHLLWLLGFRNRLSVLLNWVWSYFTYDRSVKIIVNPAARRRPAEPAVEDPVAR
ncbi:MAG: NAD(P)/FAD-dependent oxidoreductase [Chloroflexi bacterium]|nr:NAD(P)/FAD-dependent oxidoreductase [Chloroflexota bacterium]